MKILYVEDELAKNIPRITRLFAEYLGEERIKRLEALEKDESGYGAAPEKIQQVVEETHIIDVKFRFPDALEKVIHHHDEYILFVIDRNLIESGYTLEEIQGIDPNYDEMDDQQYSGREGDYLLLKLGYHQKHLINNVYFLTAYSAQDEFRSHQEINAFVNLQEFKKEHFVEKGSTRDLERLRDEVNKSLADIPHLPYQRENNH